MKQNEIAEALEEYAELLQVDGQPGRAAARDKAARRVRTVRNIPPDPARLSGVGRALRSDISTLQRDGEIKEFEKLREEYDWYLTLTAVDGIGQTRAIEIYETFNCTDLEDLLLIGSDLEIVGGIGPRTREKIMESARQLNDDS